MMRHGACTRFPANSETIVSRTGEHVGRNAGEPKKQVMREEQILFTQAKLMKEVLDENRNWYSKRRAWFGRVHFFPET